MKVLNDSDDLTSEEVMEETQSSLEVRKRKTGPRKPIIVDRTDNYTSHGHSSGAVQPASNKSASRPTMSKEQHTERSLIPPSSKLAQPPCDRSDEDSTDSDYHQSEVSSESEEEGEEELEKEELETKEMAAIQRVIAKMMEVSIGLDEKKRARYTTACRS